MSRDRMGWDLPPGVTERMIPGCRPEDDEVRCQACGAEAQLQGEPCEECDAVVWTLAEFAEAAADDRAEALADEGRRR